MVPTFKLNFCLACFSKHLKSLGLGRYFTLPELQCGQRTTPSGQRKETMNAWQFSGLAKCKMAFCKVLIAGMNQGCRKMVCQSSIFIANYSLGAGGGMKASSALLARTTLITASNSSS